MMKEIGFSQICFFAISYLQHKINKIIINLMEVFCSKLNFFKQILIITKKIYAGKLLAIRNYNNYGFSANETWQKLCLEL